MLRAAGGGIKGMIVYDGDAPPPAEKHVLSDQELCKCKTVPDESLVVDPKTKGIKWAIVRVLDVKAYTPPKNKTPAEISLKGCTFTPHVIITPPHVDFAVLNPDRVRHNLHNLPSYFLNTPRVMTANPLMGTEDFIFKKEWLQHEEIIEFQCNIHPWMKALIVCHDPRYATITGAEGSFEIKDVPPGKYKVAIFQEKFGDATKDPIDVEIKAGTVNDLGQIKYQPKK